MNTLYSVLSMAGLAGWVGGPVYGIAKFLSAHKALVDRAESVIADVEHLVNSATANAPKGPNANG